MLDFHFKICDHVLVMSKQGPQACMDISMIPSFCLDPNNDPKIHGHVLEMTKE